jgi:hypothetical protein
VTEATAARRERDTRLGVAFVLGVAYLALGALYAWQASQRLSPTIFVDEIELAQISRSIAETGSPARRGEPFVMQTLYSYVLAPAWWIDDVERAWEAVKLIGVLLMTATIFPAYMLARFVLSRPWALAAAVASVAAPPLAYGPYLMQEPLAYPVSTAGLWATAAFVAAPTRRSFAIALVAALVARFVRGELTVLLAVLAVGAAYHGWRSARFAAWRRTWSGADWAGFVALSLGAVLVASAFAGHASERWYLATGTLKQKMLDHALWAVGAVAAGTAVLPLVAGLAVLASPSVRATARGTAFALTGGAALAGYVAYAAIKGAVVSTVLGPLVVERNLIYVVPILFAATAVALSRAAFHLVALAAAAGLALWCLSELRLELDKYPYFEAPSLAIGALANRNWAMDDADVRRALYAALAVSVAVLLLHRFVRAGIAARLAAAVVFGLACSWALTAEIYAARGLNIFAERLYEATPKPVDWVDQATGGEEAIYFGQRERDPNPIWLLEFWNRSITRVWSVDGSAPAPTLTPDLAAPDGTLTPDPGVEWVVVRDGVALAGDPVGEPRGGMTLVHLDGPLRLRYAQTGVEPDGWMGEQATFSLYAAEDGRSRGFARISLSRQGACGDAFPTSNATVRLGPLAIGENKQPAIGRVTAERTVRLRPCELQTVVFRGAVIPFHVEVTIDPTFVPLEVDPSSGDARSLGAQVGFGFVPLGG